MAQKEATQVRILEAEAQLITLNTKAEVQQLMNSRVERQGTELTGMTLVLSLGGNQYLRAKLDDETVSALRGKLQSLPAADRAGYLAAWMGSAQSLIYDEYKRGTSINAGATLFSVTLPSLDIAVPAAANAFRPVQAPIIPTKVERDTSMSVQKALQIPGKGTKKEPYEIDIYDKSGDRPGTTAGISLRMPEHFEIEGLGGEVWVTYTLSAGQFRSIRDEGYKSQVYRDLRDQSMSAIEAYAKAHDADPANPDFNASLTDAMKAMPRVLSANVNAIKDEKLLAYLNLNLKSK